MKHTKARKRFTDVIVQVFDRKYQIPSRMQDDILEALEIYEAETKSQKAGLLEALKDIVEQAEKTKIMLPADLADSIKILGKQAIKNAE